VSDLSFSRLSTYDRDKLEAMSLVTTMAKGIRPDFEKRIREKHEELVQKICDVANSGYGGPGDEMPITIVKDPKYLKTWIFFCNTDLYDGVEDRLIEAGEDRAVVFTIDEAYVDGRIKFTTGCMLTLDGHTERIEHHKINIRVA